MKFHKYAQNYLNLEFELSSENLNISLETTWNNIVSISIDLQETLFMEENSIEKEKEHHTFISFKVGSGSSPSPHSFLLPPFTSWVYLFLNFRENIKIKREREREREGEREREMKKIERERERNNQKRDTKYEMRENERAIKRRWSNLQILSYVYTKCLSCYVLQYK